MAGRSERLGRRGQPAEIIAPVLLFHRGTGASLRDMWRLLLLFSALPIAAAMIARWWFGLRMLGDEGKRACRCDPARFPDPTAPAEASAAEYGRLLRLAAIADWQARDPKAAAARENSRRFGMAVPPLSGIIAIFAAIVAKIPVMGAFSILFAATALSCAFGLLSLAPELRAIAITARRLLDSRAFSRRDDEEAVLRCAAAHAWKETLPPILTLIQR
jgi:hypothetical protein